MIKPLTPVPLTSTHWQVFPIPKLFALYNQDGTDYEAAVGEGGKASMCVECGQCEGICPQHLEVISYLKDVAEKYEA